MNNCILIDDEPASRVVIRELLNRFCPEIQVIGECGDVETAESTIKRLKPDLVFLDINMPGKDGFELLKRFPEPQFSVIFITSYDQFAIKAFRFNALDYLLKPVDIDELVHAIHKFQKREMVHLSPEITGNLFHFDTRFPKISFHIRDKVHLVQISEIEYLEGEGGYVKAFLANGETFMQAQSLATFENMLADFPDFLRINKSLIINSQYLDSYSKGEICSVTLKSGASFEISRRRKAELLQKLIVLCP